MDSREIIEKQAIKTQKNQQNNIKEKKKLKQLSEEENKFVLGLVKALFLLILALSGNFLAETLSCQTQRIFEKSFKKKLLLIKLLQI